MEIGAKLLLVLHDCMAAVQRRMRRRMLWACVVQQLPAAAARRAERLSERARLGGLVTSELAVVAIQRAALARYEVAALTPYRSGRLPPMGLRMAHRRLNVWPALHAELRTTRRVREAARVGGWAQRGGSMQRRRPLPPAPCAARGRLMAEEV